ncbi:hypothetical protein [Butyrivibrio sp. AC2005]|uniref:hypothetical protein n=1 Tax=Butyrivibrio sp. AC2005 TaxID=1280672 RepID=UPI00047D5F63|nr:hypothetical protein [Butyrivibrio sp. AC2005]
MYIVKISLAKSDKKRAFSGRYMVNIYGIIAVLRMNQPLRGIKVTVSGSDNYESAENTVTFKVKVK